MHLSPFNELCILSSIGSGHLVSNVGVSWPAIICSSKLPTLEGFILGILSCLHTLVFLVLVNNADK